MESKHNWVVSPEIYDWIHHQYSMSAINDVKVYHAAQKSPGSLKAATISAIRESHGAIEDNPYAGMYTLYEVERIVFVEVCDYYKVWQHSEAYDSTLKHVTKERQEVKTDTSHRPTKEQLEFLHEHVICKISGAVLEKMRSLMKASDDLRRTLSETVVTQVNHLLPSTPACLMNLRRGEITDIVMLMLMTGAEMQSGSGIHKAYTYLVKKFGPITIYDNAVSAAQTEANQQENEDMNQTTISTPAFETRHFVNGRDVSSMSDNELIEAIRRLETEIADLKTVKTKSKAITKKIEELDGMLSKTVEILDARS